MTTQALTRSVSGTLNGSGAGTLQIGPTLTNEQWLPESVSIQMTGVTPTTLATVTLYAGSAATAGNFVDATYNVNNASSSMIAGQALWPGQFVFAVWLGGNAGAIATMVIQGSRKVP